jgi:hypothetical protein
MNLILKQEQYSVENVQFLKTRKNVIMENSLFIKLLYSDENMVMNSIYVEFPLKIQNVTRNIMFFNPNENIRLIEHAIKLEDELIHYYKMVNQCTKKTVQMIQSQIEKCNIKYNYHYTYSTMLKTIPSPPILNEKTVLKISGIWESEDSVGINYKIIVIPLSIHKTDF